MDLVILTFLAGVAFLLSWWLTGRVRRYALDRRLLDVPNVRSSHSVVTPRGGGMAIVVATSAAIVAAGALGVMDWSDILGLLGGGVLVAIIGFVDDHTHLARRWRLLGHFAAAAWILFILGGLPPLDILGHRVDLGWLGPACGSLYVVWLLNLTNFMDGIDGIASIEVITVTLGGVLLCVLSGYGTGAWIAPLLLGSATAGFLVWNWPPAKIFMGDVGSGFVGVLLGALSLQAGWLSQTLLWGWLILLGVFTTDATVTLLRRMARGERFYEPHRTHAYQQAARRHAAHKPVTLAVAAINLCWLLPIAVLVALHLVDGLIGVVIAYAPLVVVVVRLGAGRPSAIPSQSVGRHV